MKKIFIIGASLLIFSSSYAGFYRWVDDNGEVHFSDKVPVAASQKAHTKIDKHGITRKNIDPEAVAKKQQQADLIELERLAKQKELKKKRNALAKIRRRDQYLLSTYDDEKEITTFFESKIKMIKGNSNILTIQNTVLAKKVAKLLKQKEVNKDEATIESLGKRIVDINQTIKQYDKALLVNDKEIINLSRSYQVDHKRFTELSQ